MKINNKFLVIIRKNSKSEYRTKRIGEELKKRGFDFDVISTNEVVVFLDSDFYKRDKIDFGVYDVVLSLGTSDDNIYLVELARRSNFKIVFLPNSDKDCFRYKFYESLFINSIGIQTPKTALLDSLKFNRITEIAKGVGNFLCVIKKVTGVSGMYVDLVTGVECVRNFVKRFTLPRVSGKRNVILQEYIKETKGSDFRVYCTRDKVLGIIKRISRDNDFRSNVSLNAEAVKYKLLEDVREVPLKIMKEACLLFACIDFLKSKRGYLLIELNVAANFKAFEFVTGINVAEEIVTNLISDIHHNALEKL